METAACSDETAAGILTRSDDGYRQALAHVAHRLQDIRALKPGLTAQQATDMLWFYLGRGAWYVLVLDRHWTWDYAEQWLGDQASTALLDSGLNT